MSDVGPAHWEVIRTDDAPFTVPKGSLILRPIPRDLARCQKHLFNRQLVHLETVDAVQGKFDRFFHQQLRTAFMTLREVPDSGITDYNEFRKFLLCKLGYHKDRVHVFETPEIAASVRPVIAENISGFALILQDGCNLIVRRAKSQRIGRGAEMTAEERQQSYNDCLDYAAEALLQVSRHQLAIASESNA